MRPESALKRPPFVPCFAVSNARGPGLMALVMKTPVTGRCVKRRGQLKKPIDQDAETRVGGRRRLPCRTSGHRQAEQGSPRGQR